MQTRTAAVRPTAAHLSSRTPAMRMAKPMARCSARAVTLSPMAMAAALQFVKGVDESCVPEVKLTRSRSGTNGTAVFNFKNPDVFADDSGELGQITGMYMVDDEGEMPTVDVQAKFVNGKPDRIEATFVMRSSFEWDRFMRFMERY